MAGEVRREQAPCEGTRVLSARSVCVCGSAEEPRKSQSCRLSCFRRRDRLRESNGRGIELVSERNVDQCRSIEARAAAGDGAEHRESTAGGDDGGKGGGGEAAAARNMVGEAVARRRRRRPGGRGRRRGRRRAGKRDDGVERGPRLDVLTGDAGRHDDIARLRAGGSGTANGSVPPRSARARRGCVRMSNALFTLSELSVRRRTWRATALPIAGAKDSVLVSGADRGHAKPTRRAGRRGRGAKRGGVAALTLSARLGL